MEVIIGDAGGNTIVEHKAIVTQHQAIAALARCELHPGIGVDTVEEGSRILALNVDLAERAGIEKTAGLANLFTFAQHGLVHVFAILWVVPCTFPVTDIFEHGTVILRPIMHRCLAHHIEQPAPCFGRQWRQR